MDKGRTMNAVDKISPKLSSCAAACRGFPKLDSIATGAYGRVEDGLCGNLSCTLGTSKFGMQDVEALATGHGDISKWVSRPRVIGLT